MYIYNIKSKNHNVSNIARKKNKKIIIILPAMLWMTTLWLHFWFFYSKEIGTLNHDMSKGNYFYTLFQSPKKIEIHKGIVSLFDANGFKIGKLCIGLFSTVLHCQGFFVALKPGLLKGLASWRPA